MHVNLLFEGGGILGIAYVGAYQALKDYGVKIDHCMGISAGSIISALIAAEYTPEELCQTLRQMDLSNLKCKTDLSKRSLVGKPISLFVNKGIYDSKQIERWMDELLKRKGFETFQDIINKSDVYLSIIAADSTDKQVILLPEHLSFYGVNPLTFKIAKAVRMSSAIPFYFTPVKLSKHNRINQIVDGGIVKDIPMHFIHRHLQSSAPLIRFKLKNKSKFNFLTTSFQKNHNDTNTIIIENKRSIRIVDFNIDRQDMDYLYEEGYRSTEVFLKRLFHV